MGFAGNYASTTPGRKPLYIGGLLPLTKGSSPDFGPTAFAGCKLAVDDINNRSDVLPDYELIVNWTDTQVRIEFKSIFYIILLFSKCNIIVMCSFNA